MKSEGERQKGYRRQWSSEGSCSRGANCAFGHDGQKKGKEKGDKQQRAPRPTAMQTPNSDVSNQTGKRHVKKKRSTSVLCFRQKVRCRSGVACPIVHLREDDQSSSPNCQPKTDKLKDSNMIAQDEAGETSLQVSEMENIQKRKP